MHKLYFNKSVNLFFWTGIKCTLDYNQPLILEFK